MRDLNDLAQVVRLINELGEDVFVSCDRDGCWSVQHGTRVACRATDGRDVLNFLYGMASIFQPD